MRITKMGLLGSFATLLAGCGAGHETGGAVSLADQTLTAKASVLAEGALRSAPVEVGALPRSKIDQLDYRPIAGAAKCNVRVVELDYHTAGPRGDATNASAALLLPAGPDAACKGPFPLIAYGRGTEIARGRTLASLTDWETQALSSFFAAQGYAVVATDYVGYAKSSYGYHPFLHSASEASSIIGSIRAARHYAAANDVKLKPQVMLYGYSQGGHATLSAQKAIQSNGALVAEMGVAAAGHGAAPAALGNLIASGKPILYGQVLGPFFITAAQKTEGGIYSSPSEIFGWPGAVSGNLASYLPGPLNFFQLVGSGLVPPTLPGYDYTKDLYTQSFQEGLPAALQPNAPASPARAAVLAAQRNDLTAPGWTPTRPTLLCTGSEDPVVPFPIAQQPLFDQWRSNQLVTRIDVHGQALGLAGAMWGKLPADQKAMYGNDLRTYVALGYHDIFVMPFCFAAAKNLFEAVK